MSAHTLCRHPAGCSALATCGGTKAGEPELCFLHGEESREDSLYISRRTCVHPGCTVRPSYGAPCRTVEFCGLHAEPGMIYSRGKLKAKFKQVDYRNREDSVSGAASTTLCRRPTCTRRAMFGLATSKRRELCAVHAKETPGMVPLGPVVCGEPGCIRTAVCGVHGSNKREFCLVHAREGMVNIVSKRCYHRGCQKMRTCGLRGTYEGFFCRIHAPPEMVNLSLCHFLGCRKTRTHGTAESGLKVFCAEHAADGMTSLKIDRTCHEPGCSKASSFGLAGSQEYCRTHAREGMTNSRGRIPNEYEILKESHRKMMEARRESKIPTCAGSGCREVASHGVSGSGKREYCASHAKEGMTFHCASRTERCHHRGCLAEPVLAGDRQRDSCPQHADTERGEEIRPLSGGDAAESNLGNAPDTAPQAHERRTCGHPGCTKKSSYGCAGSQRPEFCAPHAAKGMVDLRHKSSCAYVGCTRRPSYAMVGGVKAAFCAVHAKTMDGLVKVRGTGNASGSGGSGPTSLRDGVVVKEEPSMSPEPPSKKKRTVDIPDKTCGYPGCTTKSSYGRASSRRPEFCAPHAVEGMVDLRHKSRCRHAGCTRRPSYAMAGSVKAEICAEHAKNVRGLEYVRGRGGPDGSSGGGKQELRPAGLRQREDPQIRAEGLTKKRVAGGDVHTQTVMPAGALLVEDAAVPEPFMGFGRKRRRAGGVVHSPLTSSCSTGQLLA